MTERTPLRAESVSSYDPQYVFNTGRLYRNKVRQFQCCVCATILACFLVALVATVAYSVDSQTEDAGNSSKPDNNSADDVLVSLLSLSYPLPDPENASWFGQTPSVAELEEALDVGQAGLRDRDAIEAIGPRLDANSPSYRHQMAVRTSAQATRLSRAGYVLDLATRHLVKRGMGRPEGSREPVGRGPSVDADWIPKETCTDSLSSPCHPAPFRSADGSCNNHLHPNTWGVALRPFRRTIPPDYADGVSAPRAASDGGPLPSAREISIRVHRPMYRDDPDFTVMLAVWGQFIDHDITATALTKGGDGSAISCCGNGARHPECFPVELASGDPYFNQFNLSCMEFVRSAPAPACSFGPREQLNQASAYLDGSVVYGPNLNLTLELRSMQGGRLRMSLTPDGRTLLPYSSDPSDGCNQEQENARGRYCFASGDPRANENLHLTTMHLLWARQHNAVADRLADLNPSWDDERVFQETRRIVVAQIQHITYSEFLPVLLGDELMNHLDLSPRTSGYFHGYNISVDATIANSFASSAFRFGHTLLPGLMKMLGNGTEEYVELHRMLFNPYSLYTPGRLDDALRGALDTQVEKVDPYFTKELTEHLFEQATSPATADKKPCGLDLVSLNIQRGRDHGLPGYTVWRERCGLTRPRNFSDMAEYVDKDSLWRMTEIYRSVEDIDLYTGGLAERPLEGGFLGPTITCLLADQFTRLKKGDRFWYETPEAPQAFTSGQLHELRKTSLARIICDNADAVRSAQPLVMRSAGRLNERVSCSSLPAPNLGLWQELPRLQLGLLPTAVQAMSSRLDTRVTTGQVTSDTGTLLWDGRYPLPLPTDSSLRPLWSGELTSNSLHGTFSLQQDSGMWLNGKLSFLLSAVWDQTALQHLSGSFMSPVYFNEMNTFDVPESPTTMALNTSQELSTRPSVITETGMATAPIILKGTYSRDRKLFWWSGGVAIALPSAQYINISTQVWAENTEDLFQYNDYENYTTPDNRSSDVSWKESYNSSEENAMSADKVFRGSVLSGAITSNRNRAILWDNKTFPLSLAIEEIPQNGLRKIFLSEIFWNGSVSSTSSDDVTLQGMLSFQSTSLDLAVIQDGFFSISLKASTPLRCPVRGVFKSPIYLEESAQIERQELLTTEGTTLNLGLITSRIAGDRHIEVPFTLLGKFTTDKSVFLWFGDVSFTVLETQDQSDSASDSDESRSNGQCLN